MRILLLTAVLLGSFSINSFAMAASPIAAAASSEETKPEEKEEIKDIFGRDTPRSMTENFLSAVGDQDYNKAANYLNLTNIAVSKQKTEGPKLVKKLQASLDQAGKIRPHSVLSNEPKGAPDDKLDPNIDRIGSIKTAKGTVNLYVERIEMSGQAPYWVINSETVKKIPDVSKDVTSSLVNKVLPRSMILNEWWGVPVGHWLALVTLALSAYAFVWSFTNLIAFLCCKVRRIPKEKRGTGVFNAFLKPVQLYLAVIVFIIIGNRIGVSIVARQNFARLAEVTAWLSLAWLAWRLIDAFANTARSRLINKGQFSLLSAVVFLRRSLKFGLFVIVSISVLDSFGFKVTTWLAALGLGGLALALGAQKTVENFVGSLTLIADRPINIGDFCKFGDTKGTVDDIGMRSTRIRTPDRTIVTIPNGDFVSMQIENYSKRDNFPYNPTISLRYDTTPDQMRKILIKLRAMLNDMEKVNKKTMRVQLLALSASSLDIKIITNIEVKTLDEANEVTEDINLGIMDIVRSSGSWFAYIPQDNFLPENNNTDKPKKEAKLTA